MSKVIKPRSLDEIRESQETLEVQLNQILASAEEEDRDFSPEEATQVRSLTRQIADEQSLIEARQAIEQKRLNDAERQRRIDRATRGNRDTIEGQGQKMSWMKMIRGAFEGKQEGLEKEIVEEGFNEARQYGYAASLRNPLPSAFLQIATRDQDASTTNKGKETIDTQMGALIPALRPNTMLEQLGATFITGLTSPLDFPRQTSLMAAAWKAEKAAASETDANFDNISLTPHRLAAWVEFTKDILFQSSIAMDTFVKNELENAVRLKLDKDLIGAASGGDAPTGLLNIANTNNASPSANANVKLDWAGLVNFYKLISVEDADVDNMKFYSNPLVAYDLMTTQKVSSTTGEMLLDKIGGTLAGFPALFSTQVPSDLTDTTYKDQSAMIFGNWRDFLVAQFSGIDLLVDPYTKGKEAMIQVIIHSWWDCDVRHPESFSIAKTLQGTTI